TISNNTAVDGGGIFNGAHDAVTMNGGSKVTGNKAEGSAHLEGRGGGIFNSGAVTMNRGTKVTGNDAADLGGGIYNNEGTLPGAAAGRNVRNNTPDNIFNVG
ncbi:MAG: hypothetical protein LBV34_15080, partial [Nocardiopsaceae bacterium]|nr:hypothetical protein [Nocardiopsaceae bacterium]